MYHRRGDIWSGLLVLGAVGLLSGCWVKKEVGQRMQADILALQTEFEVVKQAHAKEKEQLAQRLQEADKRIAELKAIIDEYQRAAGRNAADVGVTVERIKSQVMEMRGQIEVNQHHVEDIEKRLASLGEDVSSSREESKQQADLAAQQKTKTERAGPLSGIERPADQKAFYKLAYSMLDSGQVKAARMLFEEQLEKWPKGEYADNALYWIAESHYLQKNYPKAAFTFQKVRQQFPKGDKAPDALLKLGYCFYAMGKYQEAMPFLKEFVQTYPRSRLAKKARQKIKDIQTKLKSKK